MDKITDGTLEMLEEIKNAENLDPAMKMVMGSLTTIIYQLEKINTAIERLGKLLPGIYHD